MLGVGILWLWSLLWVLGLLTGRLLGVLGTVVYLLLVVPVPVLGSLGIGLLGLLARLPVVGDKVRSLLLTLVATLGDAAVWTRAPIRADAMRDTVRAKVQYAADRAKSVVVIAHSQGAAVAARALLRDDFREAHPGAAERLVAVVTIGGGNSLLREPVWRSPKSQRPDVVEAWAAQAEKMEKAAQTETVAGGRTRWINIWASLDPVPSGPVGATKRAAKKRWQELKGAPRKALGQLKKDQPDLPLYTAKSVEQWTGYRTAPHSALLTPMPLLKRIVTVWRAMMETAGSPSSDPVEWIERRRLFNTALWNAQRCIGTGPGPIGPEERVVENRLSMFADHTTYTENTIEVIEPLSELVARVANGNAEPQMLPTTPAQRAHRRGISMLALQRLSLAAVAILATPGIVRVLDGWLMPDRQGGKLLSDWAEPISLFVESIRKVGWWAGPLFVLTVVIVYLLLAWIATAVWKWYDGSLAWNGMALRSPNRELRDGDEDGRVEWRRQVRDRRKHLWTSCTYFALVVLSASAAAALGFQAVAVGAGTALRGASLLLVAVASICIGAFALFVARSRSALLPLPERHSAEGAEESESAEETNGSDPE